MAYDSRGLSVVGYANGWTMWNYQTTDARSALGELGYFNQANEMLRPGDMIFATHDLGVTSAQILVVASTTSGLVTVTQLA